MKAGSPAIIVEESFPCSVEALWKAITDANEMRSWFFEEIEDFKPESCIGGWQYFINGRLKAYIESKQG